MALQIQLRRGTAAQWTAANPILASGELAAETDTGKFKIGDGTTAWSSLAYFTQGVAGTAGAAGSTWTSGTGAPSSGAGAVGDWYLDDANGNVHQKTSTTAWTLRDNLTGPAGAAGATGSAGLTGPTGATGADGATGGVWFSGITAPDAGTGAVGDWYLDTATGDVYSKTGASTWTLKMNIGEGPAGPQGTQGIQGIQGIQGDPGPALAITGTGLVPVVAGVVQAAAKLVENADVAADAAIVESKLALNNPTHANTNDPTAAQKAALAGTSGTPGSGNKYVTDADARLTDARTPVTHAASHQNGGADEVATATPGANATPKAGALGTLDAGWIPSLDAAKIGSGMMALARGGNGASLVATGPGYLKQATTGGNVTVGAIAAADIPAHSAALLTSGTVTRPIADLGGQVCNVTAYGATGGGTTDDTTAINAASTAAGAGGIVYFPAGTYITSAALIVAADGQTWYGPGTIKVKTGSVGWGALISLASRSNCTIRDLGIDGNKAAITGAIWGVLVNGGSNNLVEHLAVRNASDVGIRALDVAGFTVRGCTVSDAGLAGQPVQTGISIEGSSAAIGDILVEGNTVTGSGYNGIFVSGGAFASHTVKVVHNTSTGSGVNGAGQNIYVTGASGYPMRSVVVAGNIANDVATNDGIDIIFCEDFAITGNTCDGNYESGIAVASCTHGAITGNHARNNGGGGVEVTNVGGVAPVAVVVTGNECYANNQRDHTGGGTGRAGVWLYGATHCTVVGNVCSDLAGSAHQRYGVLEESTSDYNVIADNECTGNVVAPYALVGASTTCDIGKSFGASVASATTITPTGAVFHVTGATAIVTINLPFVGFRGAITILPDGAFTTTTAGNIALASTAVVGKVLVLTYDGTKWYPSY